MKRFLIVIILVMLGHLTSPHLKEAVAQDVTQLGGDLTTDLPGRFALQLPAPNISSEASRIRQLSGFAVFHKLFQRSDGLGPSFVNRSCGGCHVENGRGPTSFPRGKFEGSPMMIKVALRERNADGSAKGVPGIGQQLQNHTVSGGERFDVSLRWLKVRGSYPDGKRYTLRRPRLTFRAKGFTQRKLRSSLRMSPILIGSGLLESVPESVVLEREDATDVDGDGISGRANYVPSRTDQKALGRFGFKATHPTVKQQSAAALFFDMGVTTKLFSGKGGHVELPDDELDRLVVYQTLAGVPQSRNQIAPEVVAGKSLFFSAGCESCHRINLRTESSSAPELDGQTIHPFTDLLLHDMGPGLADNHPEFLARGPEWRTAPLWGLGFSGTVSAVRPRYLHDGRARSIEEAILWHGGEALASRNYFMALPLSERQKLLAFLSSL